MRIEIERRCQRCAQGVRRVQIQHERRVRRRNVGAVPQTHSKIASEMIAEEFAEYFERPLRGAVSRRGRHAMYSSAFCARPSELGGL